MSTTEKKWEAKMHEARGLRKKGAGQLYDRLVLMIECYDDPAFRAWHEAAGTNDLDFLDEELNDTGHGFLDFRGVMAEYPKREDWIKHNIRQLIALTMKAEADARKRDGVKDGVKWKARALAAEAECERLRGELASMKESLGIVASAKCN